MRILRSLAAILAVGIATLAAAPSAFAHGGQMQGPGTGGGGGPGTGGGGGGPTTGGGGVPGGPADAPGPSTSWEAWWAANKDSFLRLGEGMREVEVEATPSSERRSVSDGESALAARAAREAMARDELVPVFLSAMDDSSFEVRTAAAIALGKSGDARALATLLRASTDDGHKDVRESAILALGLLAKPQAMPALDAVMRDRQAPTRSRGFAALALSLIARAGAGAEGHGVGDPLCSAVGDDIVASLASFNDRRGEGRAVGTPKSPPDLTASVYFALGLTGRPEALAPLRDALSTTEFDDQIRSSVILALGRLRDRESLPELVKLLRHRNGGIRRAAVIALGRTAEPTDLVPVQSLLDAMRSDNDPLARHFAAIALGQLGAQVNGAPQAPNAPNADPASLLPALRAAFAHEDATDRVFLAIALAIAHDEPSYKAIRRALEQEKTESARGGLSIALGIAGDRDARPQLEREVTSRGAIWPAGYAALALGMLRARESAPLLRKQLEDTNDPRLRANLAVALGLMKDQRGEDWLRDTLKSDGTLYERGGAAMALGQLRSVRNVPELLASYLRKKDHELVRALSLVALGVIADPENVPRLAELRFDSDYTLANDALTEAMSIF